MQATIYVSSLENCNNSYYNSWNRLIESMFVCFHPFMLINILDNPISYKSIDLCIMTLKI